MKEVIVQERRRNKKLDTNSLNNKVNKIFGKY